MKQPLAVFTRIFVKVSKEIKNGYRLKAASQLRKMTVNYSQDVATAKFQTLFKLLFLRWRGSVMKLLWRDLLLYFSLYVFIQIVSLVCCWPKKNYDYLDVYREYVPLSFLLGFFVTNVMVRWWDQYMNIPWPYSIATYVSSTVHGYDEVGRAMRRTIMRYVCLSLTMVFRALSGRVRARFPKMSDMVTAGLLMNSELKIIEELEGKFPKYGKNWLPIVWAASIVNRARADGRIRDDFAVKTLIKELNVFRSMCGTLMNYNVICIPLVYLQVVTIAVYAYFVVGLFTHQCLEVDQVICNSCTGFTIFGRLTHLKEVSLYRPILLMLQFIVYMGWLKVAETMLNPFGDDDDDFEVNFLIDKNLRMSYMIVDEMHNEHPELLKDQYWDKMPKKLNDLNKEENEDEAATDVPSVPDKQIIIDVEASEMSLDTLVTSSHQHLIPNASVIDPSYQNKPNIAVEQSMFRIEQARQKQLIKASLESIVKKGLMSSEESVSKKSTAKRKRRRSKVISKKESWSDVTTDYSNQDSEEKIIRNSKTTLISENITNKPKDEEEKPKNED